MKSRVKSKNTIFTDKKWNNHQKLLFLKNLTLLLENGFSINESCQMLPNIWTEQRTTLKKINQLMVKNHSFSNILNQLGFSKTIATQIQMALEQGTLITCLNQLITVLELKEKQTKKIIQELTYPAMIISMMILLLVFMKGFLANYLPQMQLSLIEFLFYLVMGIFVIVFVAMCFFCFQAINQQNYRKLKIISYWPIIGPTVTLYVQYLILFNVQILAANGFSIMQICQFCQHQNPESIQFTIGKNVEEKLSTGQKYSEIIKSNNFLPNELNFVTTAGNNHHQLTKQILILEQMVYAKLTTRLQKLSLKIQPICFIAIGIGIISIYAKLLLPIYKIMDTI